MSILENITLSLQSLRANKMRALLTMLGIIIGISAVIGIVTLGDSLTGYITENLSSFGANSVEVFIQSKADDVDSMYMYVEYTEDDMITNEMLASLQEAFQDEIEVVRLESVGTGQTTEGSRYANLNLQGVDNGYFASQNYTLLQGRYFTERDLEGLKRVCVVSDKLANNMFGNEDPIGQQIFIEMNDGWTDHTAIYTIVGVYEYDVATMGYYSGAERDITTPVYIPVPTASKINGTRGYFNFLAVVNMEYNPTEVADQIASYLNGFYSRNERFGVQAVSLESMLDSINSIFSAVQTAISAIAAISLLVGGIGVMNIMLVSITERTHEIGIRKALGATNGEIRVQFIVEAMIICLIGGIIGIILGTLLGIGGAALLGAPARPGISTVIIATGFSMAIGVFFGYYPANKAAKLDPIEALRYE